MKYTFYVALFSILLPINLFAQKAKQDTIQPFLYLQDGTMLQRDQFEMKRGLFGRGFYQNGEKIDFQNIKFYQSSKEYYAAYGNRLVTRKEKGTLDLYTFVESSTYYTSDGYSRRVSTKHYLYTKGFDDLKLVSYDNLKSDFKVFPNNDHPGEKKIVLDLLEKGLKRKKTRKTLVLSGLGGMLLGTACFAAGFGPDETGVTTLRSKGLTYAGLALTTGGLGVSITGLVMRNEREYYVKALKHYNKFY